MLLVLYCFICASFVAGASAGVLMRTIDVARELLARAVCTDHHSNMQQMAHRDMWEQADIWRASANTHLSKRY